MAAVEVVERVPAKRDLIVAAGHALFLEAGYGATSMDAIAERAGVSKRTVYSHFGGKEALFAGVIGSVCTQLGLSECCAQATTDRPEEMLRTFATQFVTRMTAPDALALMRTIIAATGEFPELGRLAWDEGPARVVQFVSDYLREMDRQGVLRIADPELSAMQFISMVKGPFDFPVLLRRRPPPTKAEVERAVDLAVSTFLHGLTPTRTKQRA